MEKILTFDCYGTLLNTAPLYGFIAQTAAQHGLDPGQAAATFAAYEDRLMYGEDFMPYDELLQNVLTYCDLELSTNIFTPLHAQILALHRSFAPFSDVLPALAALKAQGRQLALMSNTTQSLMQAHLQKLGGYFDLYLTADTAQCYKPSLQFFRLAEEAFNIPGKRHIHIAKGYWWDIVPAAKMGWPKIWLNRSKLNSGRPQEQPYAIITTLAELPPLLQK